MPKGGHSDEKRQHKHRQQENTPQAKAFTREDTSIHRKQQTTTQGTVPAKASPTDDMYDKRLIQQRVVDEMQDSFKIDGQSITTASKSISSSNELFPSPSTCRDWHIMKSIMN
jgi:hypothetical protein